MIILILASTNHPHLTDELYQYFLILCIELLEGGNIVIQNSFYNYFTSYPKSENIFKKLYDIINSYTSKLTLNQTDIGTNEENDIGAQLLEQTLYFL